MTHLLQSQLSHHASSSLVDAHARTRFLFVYSHSYLISLAWYDVLVHVICDSLGSLNYSTVSDLKINISCWTPWASERIPIPECSFSSHSLVLEISKRSSWSLAQPTIGRTDRWAFAIVHGLENFPHCEWNHFKRNLLTTSDGKLVKALWLGWSWSLFTN